MAVKLSPRQQAQLAWLEQLPKKLEKLHKIVELMAVQQADDTQIRGASRLADELKGGAANVGLTPLADGFGYMGMMLRRTGGTMVRVRGLRELIAGTRVNAEGARRSASTPDRDAEAEDPTS